MRYPTYQIVTLQFLAVTELQLWSKNIIIVWLGVTAIWRTVLNGCSTRKVENHHPKERLSQLALWLWKHLNKGTQGIGIFPSISDWKKGPAEDRSQPEEDYAFLEETSHNSQLSDHFAGESRAQPMTSQWWAGPHLDQYCSGMHASCFQLNLSLMLEPTNLDLGERESVNLVFPLPTVAGLTTICLFSSSSTFINLSLQLSYWRWGTEASLLGFPESRLWLYSPQYQLQSCFRKFSQDFWKMCA